MALPAGYAAVTFDRCLAAWLVFVALLTLYWVTMDVIAWLTPEHKRSAKQRARLAEAAERWRNPPDCDP